jgi:hypothetical protein
VMKDRILVPQELITDRGFIRTSFTSEDTTWGVAWRRSVFRFERPGKAFLGWVAWHLLEDSRYPMSAHLRACWIQYLRRDNAGAIRDYNEARGVHDVDVGKVLETLKGAKELREDGTN